MVWITLPLLFRRTLFVNSGASWWSYDGGFGRFTEVKMRALILMSAAAVLVLSGAAVAFEEQKGAKSGAPAAGPSTSLTERPAVPKSSGGIAVRIPGLGVIGEIPKMDFGLELLYGASQPKVPSQDDSQASGVMGRVNIPLKTPR